MTINEYERLTSVLIGYRNKLNEYGQYIYDTAQDIDYLIKEISDMPKPTYNWEVSDGPSDAGVILDDELNENE